MARTHSPVADARTLDPLTAVAALLVCLAAPAFYVLLWWWLGAALLATHLNGQRLDLDHGYPLRLIAPNRAGVLNTKWLSRVVVS